MPEYSTPKVTPTETTKIPGMNGNSSGYIDAKDLLDIIRATFGQANGVATLGPDGKLTSSQLPDLADDVIVATSYATLPNPGTAGKLYITADNNKMYRWDDTLATPDYVELSVDLSDYALISEIMDGTIQAGVAVQAWQDILGNAIITTYATKAEANDLKNALQATNARVENLEQEHGSYNEVTAKSPYIVPSGKAKNWSVNVLRGVSRGKNQLLDKSTWGFSITQNGVTFTNNGDGSVTVSTASSGATANTVFRLAPSGGDSFQMMAGHQYLMAGCPSGGSSSTYMLYDNYYGEADTGNGYIYNKNATRGMVVLIRIIAGAVITTPKTFRPIITDLTTYFGGTIPSDAQTIADIQTNYPELLVPTEYGSSLVSTTYEGVRGKGVNLWNQEWEWGSYGGNLGEHWTKVIPDQNWGGIRCAEPIPVKPNVTYWVGFVPQKAVHIQTMFIDDDGIIISYASAQQISYSFTVPANCHQILIRTNSNYSTDKTYHNDIQLCDDSLDSTTKNTWHDYLADNLSLPTPITLRSAGSVADTYELSVEVSGVNKRRQTTRVTTYTFTGNETWTWNGSTFWYMSGYTQISKLDAVMASNGIILSTFATSAIVRVYVSDNPQISSSTDMNALFKSGVVMDYPLATESVTLLDPIQNPYLPTEAGGTISSILTDAVDDSMTLGYINL